jgi:hypothetical protein
MRMGQQREIDDRFITAQTAPFRNALRGGVGNALTYRSGRFSPKAYSRCSTQGMFLRKDSIEKGKPKIALIIDCSGSMGGDPIDGAANLAYILSMLHESNAIDARIYCSGKHSSGVGGGFKVPLPQPKWVWEHLMAPHGSEFLSQTFYQFRNEIVECDLLACYTDADISDHALKPSLWRKHGRSCVGLYQGSIGQISVMRRYFDYAIARENIEDLFSEYLRLVTRLIQKKV